MTHCQGGDRSKQITCVCCVLYIHVYDLLAVLAAKATATTAATKAKAKAKATPEATATTAAA